MSIGELSRDAGRSGRSAPASSPLTKPGPDSDSLGSVPVRARSLGGRTRITSRALDRVVGAVSAEALGVEARAISVELGDDHGQLTVSITAPVRVVSLTRVAAGVSVLVRDGGPLLERAARAQDRILARAGELTGYDINRVHIRLSDVEIRPERRVK